MFERLYEKFLVIGLIITGIPMIVFAIFAMTCSSLYAVIIGAMTVKEALDIISSLPMEFIENLNKGFIDGDSQIEES